MEEKSGSALAEMPREAAITVRQGLLSARRSSAFICAIVGWSALTLQIYVTIQMASTSGKPLLASMITLCCYFTILTNTAATVCLTVSCLSPSAFRPRPSVITALALYITIVGVVYALLLRRLWEPQGWQRVTDVLLHDVMPTIFVLFWLLFIPKGSLRWKSPFVWLIYPLAYLGFTLLRGASTGVYPYPFIDVTVLGYAATFWNAAALTLVFLGLGFILVAIDRLLGRSSAKPRPIKAVGSVAQ